MLRVKVKSEFLSFSFPVFECLYLSLDRFLRMFEISCL